VVFGVSVSSTFSLDFAKKKFWIEIFLGQLHLRQTLAEGYPNGCNSARANIEVANLFGFDTRSSRTTQATRTPGALRAQFDLSKLILWRGGRENPG